MIRLGRQYKKIRLRQARAISCAIVVLITNPTHAQTSSSNSAILPPIINLILEGEADFGLDPNAQPWENFDLSDWGLDSPALRDIAASETVLVDTDGDGDFDNIPNDFERGVRIEDSEFIALTEGANNSGFSSASDNFFGTGNAGDNFEPSTPYFYTASDGGMVFKSPVDGGRTSTNTSFSRSELREMLRAGNRDFSTQGVNENNWVLGYQPTNLDFGAHTTSSQDETPTSVGGRNGQLTATLRVNQVTSTGRNSRVGRVIIGQIHADDDEPLRLYYRKLPTNERGSVYFVHEIRGSADLENFDLVGSSDNPPANHSHTGAPISDTSDGIALDELFSYEITNVGSIISVVIRRGDYDGEIIGEQSIDMLTTELREDDGAGDLISTGSFYNVDDEWMYFKAGAYSQNNTEVSTDRTDGRGAATTGFGVDTTGDGIGDEPDYDQVTFYRLNNTHD